MSNRRALCGFTLIELLVAMTVFAIMSTAMYTVFASYQQTRDITDRDARRLASFQRFFNQFGREILQAESRPIRDESQYAGIVPAFVGARESIEFSRNGWNQASFATVLRSELQRVSYSLENGNVIRSQWKAMDRVPNAEVVRIPVLDHVEELSFRFFQRDASGSITEMEKWPVITEAGAAGAQAGYGGRSSSDTPNGKAAVASIYTLPVLLKVRLVTRDYGEVERSYALVETSW